MLLLAFLCKVVNGIPRSCVVKSSINSSSISTSTKATPTTVRPLRADSPLSLPIFLPFSLVLAVGEVLGTTQHLRQQDLLLAPDGTVFLLLQQTPGSP